VAKSAAQISTRLSATQLSGDLSGVPAICPNPPKPASPLQIISRPYWRSRNSAYAR